MAGAELKLFPSGGGWGYQRERWWLYDEEHEEHVLGGDAYKGSSWQRRRSLVSLGRARVLRASLQGPFWDLVCCILSLLLHLWTPPSVPVEGAAPAGAILRAAAPKPLPSCKGPVPLPRPLLLRSENKGR